MRFFAERTIFSRALAVAARTQKSGAFPVLDHVLIQAAKDQVTLTTSNLTQWLDVSFPARVDEAGQITADFRRLKSLVDGLADGAEISVEGDGREKTTVKGGRSRYSFPSFDPVDFPPPAACGEEAWLSLPPADLEYLLSVEFAVSDAETHYFLTGVHVRAASGRLRFEATDTHRLAAASVECEGAEALLEKEAAKSKNSIIIPSDTAKIIRATGGDDPVRITFRDAKMFVAGTLGKISFTLTSKMVEAIYPDVDRVIPEADKNGIEMNRAELRAALRRLMTLPDKKKSMVVIGEHEGQIQITSRNTADGTAGAETVASSRDPGPVEIGANGFYLIDALDAMTTEKVILSVPAGVGKPLRFDSPDDPNRILIIMPIGMD